MVDGAQKRIKSIGWDKEADPVDQIADAIVARGEGEEFLKAARRGRPGTSLTLRTQLVQGVEKLISAKRRKPRVREKNHAEADMFAAAPVQNEK